VSYARNTCTWQRDQHHKHHNMNAHYRSSWRATAVLASIMLVAGARPAQSQDTAPARPLTLGDAARLSARQSASAEAARYRAEQAEARVTQQRADLLPNLSAYALQQGRSFNTATLGIDFPAPAGQPPLFNPNGQVISGVNSLDVRGRISQTLIDLGAIERVRSAGASARASDADAKNSAEQAAATAAGAYLRTQSADAKLSARLADSVLADSLLLIARAAPGRRGRRARRNARPVPGRLGAGAVDRGPERA
jgi:outer membrane protein